MKRALSAVLAIVLICGCSSSETPTPRSFRMGFQNSAPVFTLEMALQSLEIWTPRADAAIIASEVPWKAIADGTDPVDYVQSNYVGLVDYYRQKNLKLWVYIDPANGLNRAADADELTDLGKSIAQPEMQAVYKRFVVVMDSLLKPEHMGLALETNLIRLLSPDSIYQGVRTAVNEVAAELKARSSVAKLSVSVQADAAWGKFSDNAFHGVEQDVIDFPFMEEAGISSYPYFFFTSPTDIPDDYFSRLFKGSLPVFISEGGWSTVASNDGIMNVSGSPESQKVYFERMNTLLSNANATALFQLSFTDLDVSKLPPGTNPTIGYFANIGLVDKDLKAKPSLAVWDQIFARPLKSGN